MVEEIKQTSQSTPVSQLDVASQPVQTEQVVPREKPKWLMWTLIVVGVVIILGIGIVVFLLISGSDTESVENTQGAGIDLEASVPGGEVASSVPETIETPAEIPIVPEETPTIPIETTPEEVVPIEVIPEEPVVEVPTGELPVGATPEDPTGLL